MVQILKKAQLYDIMLKKSNRSGISMDDLLDIVEKRKFAMKKDSIFCHSFIGMVYFK